MSTKTTLKRVALVAVSALGFGLLSVVPSKAAINSVNPYLDPVTNASEISNADGSVWTLTQTASPGGYVDFSAVSNITSNGAGGAAISGASLTVTGSTITLSASAYLKYAFIATGGTVTNSTTTGSTVSGGTISGGTLLASSLNPDSATGLAASLGCDAAAITGKVLNSYTPFNATANNAYKYTCATGVLYVARNDDAVVLAANIASSDAGNAYFRIGTSTAGSITAVLSATEIINGVNTATTLQTFNITVLGASASYKASVTSMLGSGNGWLSDESTPVVYAPKATGATVGSVTVDHLNSSGLPSPATSAPAVTFAISGVGTLNKGATTAGYIAVAAGTESSSTVNIVGDGRAGTGTITVSAGGVVVGTHTVKFYGNAAKVEAVGFYVTAQASTIMGSFDTSAGNGPSDTAEMNNDPAVAVLVTDALGTPIPVVAGLGVISNLVSSSTNPLAVANPNTASFIDSGKGIFSAGVLYNHIRYTGGAGTSGEKSTLTYSVVNASDASVITSNPVVVTIGGGLKTLTMKADKETYAPGEKITLSFEGKDASGNPAYDNVDLFYAVSANTQFGGTLPSDTNTFLSGGKATKTLFAPVVPGTFTITATLNDFSSVTSTIKVVADTSAIDAATDAAAEAIDAANAATDAANLAAEAADAATVAAEEARDAADAATAAVEELAAQVASLFAALKAQLTTLANTVAKIAKKVKA